MGSIERRIEALEAAFGAKDAADTGEGVKLIGDFERRALEAMASVKRGNLNPEPHRYSLEKLRGESPVTVVAHVAALAALEHEDEEGARELLADLERERDLDPARHERLLEIFAAIIESARQSREEPV